MSSLSTYHLSGVSLTLGLGSLHGCSSKVQPLLLTLYIRYLLLATTPDLGHGVCPLGHWPVQCHAAAACCSSSLVL